MIVNGSSYYLVGGITFCKSFVDFFGIFFQAVAVIEHKSIVNKGKLYGKYNEVVQMKTHPTGDYHKAADTDIPSKYRGKDKRFIAAEVFTVI